MLPCQPDNIVKSGYVKSFVLSRNVLNVVKSKPVSIRECSSLAPNVVLCNSKTFSDHRNHCDPVSFVNYNVNHC